jgi:hypothetical protein
MFIKRKYLVRHKILETLQERLSQFDGQEHLNIEKVELTLQELSRASDLIEKEILEQIDFLNEIQELDCNWRQGVQNFLVLKKGTIAYFDRKYLYEGRKEFWNDTYDIIKTVSAVMLLVIAVITFVMNLIDTRQNKKDINNLKTELKQLKDTTLNLKVTK